jgi:subtilase family serine protease
MKALLAMITLAPLVLLMLPGSAVMMVPKADLTFEGGVEIYGSDAGSFDPGEVMTVSVKVVNIGDVGAENVSVQMSIDGEVEKVQTLRTVGNESDDIKTVIFTWVAEEGGHHITVQLDPDDTVPESSEDNNALTQFIDVMDDPTMEGGSVETSSTSVISLPIIILVGGLFFVVGAIFIAIIVIVILFNRN